MIARKGLLLTTAFAFIATISYGETINSPPLGANWGVLQMPVDSAGNALSTLDITNNSIKIGQVQYSTNGSPWFTGNAQTFQQWLNNGFNEGMWGGTGITSGAAAADEWALTGINWCTGQQYLDFVGKTTFHGVAFQPTDFLASYGYYGDCNFDGIVNTADYDLFSSALLVNTIEQYNAAYSTNYPALGTILGDFNYDGFVDGIDQYMIENLLSFDGKPYGYLNSGYTYSVPEPSAIVLLSMGALVSFVFARRRSQ